MAENKNIDSLLLPDTQEATVVDENAKFSYKFEAFEGPLDLLLSLITKNKIDIYDICIEELLSQYMEQINAMKEEDMDIASEFLEMASRLVYIKSVMLLPKYEDEAEELKKELTGQLLEYQECRRVAKMLAPMVSFDTYSKEPSPVEFDLTYNRIHKSEDIALAYVGAVGRGKRRLPPPRDAFAGIVSKKIVSVSSRIIHVMKRLWRGRTVTYKELFIASKEKSELVATFLAVLELVKGKRVVIDGNGDDAKVSMIERDSK
ncbi:MAG: segregation/condensation protein A [Ruminococcus sp.]|nr:segregation/condensation protein A [Ruminococcus sp.]